jgi:hypothetical protein
MSWFLPLLVFVLLALQPAYHQQLVCVAALSAIVPKSLLVKRHNNGGAGAEDRGGFPSVSQGCHAIVGVRAAGYAARLSPIIGLRCGAVCHCTQKRPSPKLLISQTHNCSKC